MAATKANLYRGVPAPGENPAFDNFVEYELLIFDDVWQEEANAYHEMLVEACEESREVTEGMRQHYEAWKNQWRPELWAKWLGLTYEREALEQAADETVYEAFERIERANKRLCRQAAKRETELTEAERQVEQGEVRAREAEARAKEAEAIAKVRGKVAKCQAEQLQNVEARAKQAERRAEEAERFAEKKDQETILLKARLEAENAPKVCPCGKVFWTLYCPDCGLELWRC